MTTDFDLGYFAVGTLLFGRSLLACASMRRVPFLPMAPTGAEGESVTVVVATRSGGATLQACLDDLRAQRGCDLEIVVVDDRSDDAAAVADACAGRPGVHLTRVDHLEDGWLPWSSAWRAGLEGGDARGGWIVLLDEPLRLVHPTAIARGIAAVRGDRAVALWLVPRPRAGWLLPPALTAVADALPAMAATNRDRESVPWPAPVCIVRRDTLASALRDPAAPMAPVFEAVVMERARDAGARTRFRFASDEIDGPRARLATAVETVERLLATLGFRPATMTVALALYGVLWAVAVRGAFDPNPWGSWAFAGLASLAIPCYMIARIHRVLPLAALAAPFTFPLEAFVTGWALWRARRRGGVEWRGAFVRLDRLRTATGQG